MILTVTLNPAVDITYDVDTITVGGSHRTTAVRRRAGGKGVNVARVLRALGEDVAVAGLLGGASGREISADLDAAGVAQHWTPIAGPSRCTVTVVSATDDGTDATVFNEPGPSVRQSELHRFVEDFARLVATVGVVVLSGSLPPGIASDIYVRLVAIARAKGVRTVVDASGAALRAILTAPDDHLPTAIKPNADELREATGRADFDDAIRTLRTTYSGAVIASNGKRGITAATADRSWSARLATPIDGNPTGAGDAAVAAIARGLANKDPWPDLISDAVALSAAAVARPVAGEFDPAVYRQSWQSVHVWES